MNNLRMRFSITILHEEIKVLTMMNQERMQVNNLLLKEYQTKMTSKTVEVKRNKLVL